LATTRAAVCAVADIVATALSTREKVAQIITAFALQVAACFDAANDDRRALSGAARERSSSPAFLPKLQAGCRPAYRFEGRTAVEVRAAHIGCTEAVLAVLSTDGPANAAGAFLTNIAADAVAARRLVAAITPLIAIATRGTTATGVVEVARCRTMRQAATLATLALVVARLLEAETARAESFWVTEPFAAVSFRFTRLLRQRAAAAGDARLPVEEVLAAVRRCLAAPLGVVAASLAGALADAISAALTVFAAGALQPVAAVIAALETVRLGAGCVLTALVVVYIAGRAKGQTRGLLTRAVATLSIYAAGGAVLPWFLDAGSV
jgi:hypothetical protein